MVDAVDPVEVPGDSGAAAGAAPWGAASGGAVRGGAEPGGSTAGGAGPEGTTAEGAEPGGAGPGGAVPGDAGSGGAGSGAAEPGGATSGGGGSGATAPGVSPTAVSRREPLSPQELREWFASRWRRAAESGGAAGAGAGASSTVEGSGAAGPGAAGPTGPPGAGAAEGVGAEPTAVGPTTGGVSGAGAVAEGAGAVPAESRAAERPRPYFVPLLQQVLGLSPPVEGPPPVQSQSLLEPSSSLPAPSPYTGPTGGLAERREPASRPASPVRAARTSGCSSRQRPPPVPGTHRMSLRPSTAALRAPLPSPPASSLPALADPESDSLRAASPSVTRLLATVVTDSSFASTAASALVAELVDFAARCRLDYAAGLVPASASVCPPSVGGECALGTDVLEDRQEELQCLAAASPHLASVLLAPEGDPDALDIPTPRSYAEAVEGPYSSQWQAAMDAEMASWKSTGTYVDEVPPPGANIVSGMWIFRVKRPPGSPPVFKARYVARGFIASPIADHPTAVAPTGATARAGESRIPLYAATTHSSGLLGLKLAAALPLPRKAHGLAQLRERGEKLHQQRLSPTGVSVDAVAPSPMSPTRVVATSRVKFAEQATPLSATSRPSQQCATQRSPLVLAGMAHAHSYSLRALEEPTAEMDILVREFPLPEQQVTSWGPTAAAAAYFSHHGSVNGGEGARLSLHPAQPLAAQVAQLKRAASGAMTQVRAAAESAVASMVARAQVKVKLRLSPAASRLLSGAVAGGVSRTGTPSNMASRV
ncbi:unnamed protein product [Closterium sp. NIES-54]